MTAAQCIARVWTDVFKTNNAGHADVICSVTLEQTISDYIERVKGYQLTLQPGLMLHNP